MNGGQTEAVVSENGAGEWVSAGKVAISWNEKGKDYAMNHRVSTAEMRNRSYEEEAVGLTPGQRQFPRIQPPLGIHTRCN